MVRYPRSSKVLANITNVFRHFTRWLLSQVRQTIACHLFHSSILKSFTTPRARRRKLLTWAIFLYTIPLILYQSCWNLDCEYVIIILIYGNSDIWVFVTGRVKDVIGRFVYGLHSLHKLPTSSC